VQSQQRARGMRHIDLTDVQLASSETARRINRDIVLELIRANQPISRPICRAVPAFKEAPYRRSLSSSSGEMGMRRRCSNPARGRRPTLLGLNDSLVVIAVDIHPKQAILATVDLHGRLLSRSLVSLDLDPAGSTRRIIDCMIRMQRSLLHKSIEGIGISLPGRVDPDTQRLIFAPNLHWPDFDLKK